MKFKIGDLVADKARTSIALAAGRPVTRGRCVGLVVHIAKNQSLVNPMWFHVKVLWAGTADIITYFAHHLVAFNSQNETNEV